MGAFIDITGKKFGKLTSVEYLGASKWKCLCECGKEAIVCGSDLRNGHTKSCGCAIKKYPIDEHYFDSIDTEEKAYILGFIASDGNVTWKPYNLKIEINDDDIDVLTKIASAMNYDYTPLKYSYVCKYKDGSQAVSHTVRLNITNKTLVRSLAKYGIVPAKSNVLDMDLEQIPEDYIRHFIRGYWDGDGHIDITHGIHLSVVSTFMMIGSFILHLEKVIPNFAYTLHYRNKDNLMNETMYINRKAVCMDLLSYLYEDSNIYMDRKYKQYEIVKERYTRSSND